MQVSLEGKVAIVTGVSGDGQVGQAVAKALADAGVGDLSERFRRFKRKWTRLHR
jgi:NAD(P)-dependent dehydrogenase (short-subunit alcohol dehydrogenase family)